jgi:hypothetical protein
VVPKNREQVPNLQHQTVLNKIRSPALRPATDICSSINDSLAEIDENAADAYEQLKALLMSRYTMDRWARVFELHKFPEIGDTKPSEMMRQMKALLPPDSTPGTYFMAAFLLRLPADMIDHIISQDFKDCTKMAEYADKLYARRRGNAVAAVSDSPINTVSGGRRRESSPHDRRRCSPSRQGRSRRKTPGPYKDDSDICFYHTTYGEQARKCKPGCQWVPGNGSAAEN